jgi:hypothetical protein
MIHRTLLGFALLAALATGCASKKPPASPANAAPAESAAPGGAADGSEVKDESKPDDPDDAQKMGADPCDGGE